MARRDGGLNVRGWLLAGLMGLVLAGPARAQMTPDNIAELLAAQNAYRAPLGLAPLGWSDQLAAQAQRWAEHLAGIGQLVHSGPGQNLAMAQAGTETLTQLVDLWGGEGRYFVDGAFPDISTTGNWVDVGHYSQIIWRSTRLVGCGGAEQNGLDVLVCDYDPPGNVMGERAY
ncbi:CAP domain-containing protein [Acidocella sp.]|uniref:CAP domain-containing protein n=1 Tax=Acidocella sp. TaxID=50710 RepID=UPI002636E206|nr:CAP domain-containing protein [Acidocella sp.]